MDSLNILNKLQDAVIENQQKDNFDTKNKFDKLKMYFAEDYDLNGIIVSQPTIGDILDIGEDRFYKSLSPFLYNSTSIRVMLWENKIDWNKVSDIEVFDIMNNIIQDKEPYKLFFKNVSFNDFQLVKLKNETAEDDKGAFALYSQSQDIILKEYHFMMIAEYIREMLNMHPKAEKAKGKSAKAWIIQEDKMKEQENKERTTSILLPLVSSCVNHPGFKYKLQELRQVGIYQFMDSVKRIQKYENGTAALKGIYSGFVSAKDIDKNTLDFMGDI